MTTQQQQEALSFFNQHAGDWKNQALAADQRKVNVIRQRNDFVLDVVRGREATRMALDVGCGTGDLACDLARMGVAATGVDFAPEMIVLANTRKDAESLEKAHFECCSIFDFDLAAPRYDVISANGFIEYVNLDELERFLDRTAQALNPGGSLVLGSRNRLFNVFSINSYTEQEIQSGDAPLLLKEAIALASSVPLAELAGLETPALQEQGGEQLRTVIDVSVRYQFTPAQMAKKLTARGLAIRQLYPIQIHGVPPAFKDLHPEVHTGISNLLQTYAAQSISLVPYASSFMLHAVKEQAG